MSIFDVLILAIVQGVTEFLPVSSSGHLVVTNALLEQLDRPPVEDLLEVNIVLHVGTLLAVIAFYWRELARMLTTDRRVAPLLIVGTVPAAAVGIPLKEFAEPVLEDPLLAGCMFWLTAGILYWGSRRPEGAANYQDLSYRGAIAIGAMQALALLPGVSRSGSTIVGGLATGLNRTSAGAFAFLLAIPAIGGAGAMELVKLLRDATPASGAADTSPGVLAVGALVSFAVGWVALWQLLQFVRKGKLAVFCWYLIPLGVAVVAWQVWLLPEGTPAAP